MAASLQPFLPGNCPPPLLLELRRPEGRRQRRISTQASLRASGALGLATAWTLRKSRRRLLRTSLQFSSPGAEWPMEKGESRTLRQVIIVHRHGTRFPTKPTGSGNLSWPQRAQFWESYKGHLTPVGSKTLMDTGSVLRNRYIGHEGGIFEGIEKVDGRAIAVYTSNVQRTLQSAWSFLLGLVPDASIFFAFRSERVFSQALKQAVGVPIYVEDATEGDDKLFHEWKIGSGYKEWLKENQKKSAFLKYAQNAAEYRDLLDKLYEVSHEAKLSPRREPLSRVVAAKDVDTQVMIEEAHNRPVLPNELGEALDPGQKELLRKIGDETKRCWFGDAEGDYGKSYGKKGAGYLAHKIWRHMDERANGICHQRFVQFSCHDTTMCALAAHFGIELERIGFGAFFAFELHQTATGEHEIKFYYNSKPDNGAESYTALESHVLPFGGPDGRNRKLRDCDVGSIPLDEFAKNCRIPGLEETFESFIKLLGRADLGPTREDLEALLKDGKIGWLSFEEWQERYDADFNRFDCNQDGCLCRAEMEQALLSWYGVKGKTAELIFHLVDRDPDKDALTEQDVYLAMCALVGVRGSISSKTVGTDLSLLTTDYDGSMDVDAPSKGGITSLMSAAAAGDLQRVRDLAAFGASVNSQDDYGWTPLRYAARKKDTDMVELLIQLKADVNLGSKSGRTPLMSAVANNATNVVQLFVESGADVSAKNSDGLTAFDIASRGMGNSIVRQLVAAPSRTVP